MNVPIMLALLALVTGGTLSFFWKVAGANQTYTPSYMLVETVVFAVVAVAIHVAQGHPFDLSYKMSGLASLGGVLAAITVFSIMLAFRMGGQGSIIFPITGLGVLVSVMLTVVVYHEHLTPTRLLGLGLGVSSIIVLSR